MFEPMILQFHIKNGGLVNFESGLKIEENIEDILTPFLDKRVTFGLAIFNRVDFFEDGVLTYNKDKLEIHLKSEKGEHSFVLDDYVGEPATLYLSYPFEGKKVEPSEFSVDDLKNTLDRLKQGLNGVKLGDSNGR
jgi:hypothetical protein